MNLKKAGREPAAWAYSSLLHMAIIVRCKYVRGLLLSADVVSDAYYCPWMHFYEVLLHLPAKLIGLCN